VSGFRIDPVSAALSPTAGSPFPLSLPTALAASPDGRTLMVPDFFERTMSVLGIDPSSGALTLAGKPSTLARASVALSFDPSGRFLYSADRFLGEGATLSEYAVQGASLRLIGNLGLTTPQALAVNPVGPSVYAANADERGGGGEISSYARNADGTLSELFPRVELAQPTALAVDPQGRFLFVATSFRGSTGQLTPYRIDVDGRISHPGASFRLGLAPSAIAVDGAGRFVYVSNRGNNVIWAYAINQATGFLTEVAGTPFAAGKGPAWVTVSP
jgi:6-phosphogluconolactonase (cycloisomerase 2 family)